MHALLATEVSSLSLSLSSSLSLPPLLCFLSLSHTHAHTDTLIPSPVPPSLFFGHLPPDLSASGLSHPSDKHTHHSPVVSAYWSRDEGINTLLRTLPSWSSLTAKRHASTSGHRTTQLRALRDSVHAKVREINEYEQFCPVMVLGIAE